MPEGPKGKIFINYRRGEDSAAAGWLYGWLEQELAGSDLFMDVDIAPDADFAAVLEQAVAACDEFLVVIGKSWLEAQDASGGRLLDNPNDIVRIEIASALRLGKHVIPVLVNGAQMPAADSLPEPLKPLAGRNAVRLTTHERFRASAQRLLSGIEALLPPAAKARIGELRGRCTRRGILKWVGIGAGISTLAYLTFVPGQLIWRQINDESDTHRPGTFQ